MLLLLDRLAPFLIGLNLVSLIAGFACGAWLLNQKRTRAFFKLVLVILIFNTACLFPAIYLLPRAAISEIADAAACVKEGRLLVDGKEVDDPSPYIQAFQSIQWFMVGHHSVPRPPVITVQCEAGGRQVVVKLMRDSQYKDEYWVFYPKYSLTAENDVGRIHTDLFRTYVKP